MSKRKVQEEESENEEENEWSNRLDLMEEENPSSDLEDDATNLRQLSDKTEGEVGIIEEVTLQNFLCHKNLNIKFGPNINFIVGQNGSGKSAILVAISVGLGAKANFTNRGTKLTDLVRHGASTALIIIRLRNRGSEAFRPEDYGNSIIVERRIAKEGSSGYKLKDHTGKRTIATSATELSLILEQFNIQINNPVAILMQETSKQFLTTSKPKDKYKFFLMATQLDQMEKDFHTINSQLEIMKSTLVMKQQLLPDMEKQLKEYEREYHDLHELRNLQKRLQQLKIQLAWSFVKEAEEDLEKTVRQIKSHEEEINNYERRREELKENEKQITIELENCTKIASTDQEKLNAMKIVVSDIDRKLNEILRERDQIKTKILDSNKQKERLQMRVQKVKDHIKMIEDRIAKHNKAEIEKRYQEIGKKKEQLESLQRDLSNEKEKRIQIDEEQRNFTENYENARRDEEVRRKKKDSLKNDLSALERAKKDNVRVYGEFIPSLLESIRKNANQFHRVPVGPVGMSIKVKDDKWATAIESCIQQRNLRAFILQDEHDAEIMRQLCSRLRCPMPAYNIQKEDKLYQIPDRDLPDRRRYLTILDAIESNHAVVLNMLIDQVRIENKILIESPSEARRIMFSESPPHNVKECFTADGSRLFVTNGMENFITADGPRKYISVNVDDRIRDVKLRLETIDSEINQFSEQRRSLEQRRVEFKKQVDVIVSSVSSLQSKINHITREITDLESKKDEVPQDDTQEMRESILELEKQIAEYDEKLVSEQSKLEENQKKSFPIEQERSKKRNEIDALTEETGKIEKQVKLITVRLSDTANKLAIFEREMEKKHDLIVRLTEEKGRKELAVKENTEKATAFAPKREDSDKLPAQLDKEIQALERRIEKEQEGKKKPQEIMKQYQEAKKKFEETTTHISKLLNLQQRIEDNLNERMRRYHRFRASIARRTSLIFNINLSQKGFSGDIKFDHKKKILDIEVQLDKMRPVNQQHAVHDTKSLSGGERSYSTVSLLLSLWEAMECPFRAMDEFDVFMDSVNRQISIDLLIDSGRQHKHRQFIFITPHDYSGIKKGPDVRIHKMIPPERGQSTLSFSSQQVDSD